jgi:hypothetical protein
LKQEKWEDRRKKEMREEESGINVGLGIKIVTAMKQSFKASKV